MGDACEHASGPGTAVGQLQGAGVSRCGAVCAAQEGCCSCRGWRKLQVLCVLCSIGHPSSQARAQMTASMGVEQQGLSAIPGPLNLRCRCLGHSCTLVYVWHARVQHSAPQHQHHPAVYSDACKAEYQGPYSIALLGLCVCCLQGLWHLVVHSHGASAMCPLFLLARADADA